jgi:hypothetical protein
VIVRQLCRLYSTARKRQFENDCFGTEGIYLDQSRNDLHSLRARVCMDWSNDEGLGKILVYDSQSVWGNYRSNLHFTEADNSTDKSIKVWPFLNRLLDRRISTVRDTEFFVGWNADTRQRSFAVKQYIKSKTRAVGFQSLGLGRHVTIRLHVYKFDMYYAGARTVRKYLFLVHVETQSGNCSKICPTNDTKVLRQSLRLRINYC